jgi:hypothetical protein
MNNTGHHTPTVGSATPAPPSDDPGSLQMGPHASGDDWTFLNNFGDTADEFYTMDANFKELLQAQFDPSGHGHVAE